VRLNNPVRQRPPLGAPLAFLTVYQVKRRWGLFLGIFPSRFYDVVYEDETTLFSTPGLEEARSLAAMLNGAYNLGRSVMFVERLP
jgi:hypothetical protein